MAGLGARVGEWVRTHFAVRAVGWLGFVVGVAVIPQRLCGADAARTYSGDRERQQALARGMHAWVLRGFDESSFATGTNRYDSEWLFGSYQMAALGFGQVALEHHEDAAQERPRMERAIDRMLAAKGHAFDTEAWNRDALDALDSFDGHAAFLGYTNLVLSLHRLLYADSSRYAALNDAMTAALVRRYEHSQARLLETYPGEIYPVDNTAGIASIALRARAKKEPEPPILRTVISEMRRRSVDAATGLLSQSVTADGTPLDRPRGSGSALAAYFLSFADPAFSAALHHAVQQKLATSAFGFRALSEYPAGILGGVGDIDSGPLVFGLSISATGFALAGCRIHHDERCFREIFATADLFGAPLHRNRAGDTFVTGGPLGDAILFAMQTALPRSS